MDYQQRKTKSIYWLLVMYLMQSVALAQQIMVRVPGTSQILFSAARFNYSISSDTTQQNTPVLVDLTILPGQAIQFTADGQVDVDPNLPSSLRFASPNGTNTGLKISDPTSEGAIGAIAGHQGSLIGVFVDDTKGASTRGFGGSLRPTTTANFLSAADRIAVFEPLLAQPFLIGTGTTPDGVPRTFIVPRGAIKLYLGILDQPVSENSGGFTVQVSIFPQPPAVGLANPLLVLGTSNIMLAGGGSGADFPRGSPSDAVPLQSPGIIDIRRFGTGPLRISATGSVDLDKTVVNVSPTGVAGTNAMYSPGGPLGPCCAGQGFSGLVGPKGSLIGTFVGDQLKADLPINFTADFSTTASRNTVTVAPRLQQLFFIGNGRTDSGTAKDFVVPDGGTRLFLGINEGGGTFQPTNDNSGAFLVTVSQSGPVTITSVNTAGGFPDIATKCMDRD